jgi:ArsR family transcriptional regulator
MVDIFELHADTCKALASPARLRIIALLRDREMCAGDIVKALGVRKANVSQHLAVMRQRGIVQARREGLNVYYRLASPKVIQACELMREVLEEQIATRGELVALHESEPVATGKGKSS